MAANLLASQRALSALAAACLAAAAFFAHARNTITAAIPSSSKDPRPRDLFIERFFMRAEPMYSLFPVISIGHVES